jgi:hypothetical protein
MAGAALQISRNSIPPQATMFKSVDGDEEPFRGRYPTPGLSKPSSLIHCGWDMSGGSVACTELSHQLVSIRFIQSFR